MMTQGKDGARAGNSGCGAAADGVIGTIWPKSFIYVLVNSHTHSLICSLIHSFLSIMIYSLIYFLIHLFIHSLIHYTYSSMHCSFTPLFIYAFIQSSMDRLNHPFTLLFICTRSSMHWFIYFFIHLFILLCTD